MARILFEKKGNAIWISHLDLMRLFQRAFKRAGLPLKHTQGFNPRPSVSIALPLSVGIDSACELLDFDLDGEFVDLQEMIAQLNSTLVSGVRILDIYESGRKIRDLALMDVAVFLEYDQGVPKTAVSAFSELFSREEVLVEKKTKSNGIQPQNIIPMIKKWDARELDGNTVAIFGRICCQNPTLNPMQMVAAIEKYMPDLKPDFAKCSRIEIYDTNEQIFR